MQYGSKVSGRRVAKFVDSLSMTKPGEVYELEMEVNGLLVQNEEGVITQLLSLEQEFPDLRVLFIDTCTTRQIVTIQFTDVGPGDVSIAGVASLIPQLFILLGVVVVALILWQVLGTQPWLIYLLAIAGAFVMFYYFVGRHLEVKEVKVPKREVRPPGPPKAELTPEEKKRARLEGRESSLKTARISAATEYDKLKEQITTWEADLRTAKRRRDAEAKETLTSAIKHAKERKTEVIKELEEINKDLAEIRAELKAL